MNVPESVKTTPPTRLTPLIRAALICGILGILMIISIVAAQLVWAFNPYREATEQVNYLLQTQPDLETRLDYAALAKNRLEASLDPDLSYAITSIAGSSTEEQLIAVLEPLGIRSLDVRTFTGLLDNVAVEMLALRTELQQEDLATPLKPLFYQIRQQPEVVDSTRLNQIYTTSPLLIEDLNDLRRRLLSISNNLRLITDSAQLQPIAEAINSADLSTFQLNDAGRAVINSYTVWKSVPKTSESLEIQFAGTVSILDNIFTAVNAARLQDRRWGYSHVEPVALWINNHLVFPITAAVVLLAAAGWLFFRYGPLSVRDMEPQASENPWTIANLASSLRITQPLTRLHSAGTDRITAQINQPATSAARRRSATVAGEKANPRFLVLWPNGERETLPLSTENAFRIGSDPRNPVFIDNREAGYIEIWVRSARASFFIEVMFSESPILLNREPITGARMLHEGDLIQVLDISLLFFET